METTVHLLPHELFVATVTKDSISGITHSLLRLLLRLFSGNQEARRNHFFSFSDTCKDYSVILDRSLLKELDLSEIGEEVQVAKGKWRPLVVEVGALGSFTGVSKIAASVIAPLADRNVSVYCASTNQDDYVLVQERDLPKALSCLSEMFRVVCDSVAKSDLALVETINKRVHPLPSAHFKSSAAEQSHPPKAAGFKSKFQTSCSAAVSTIINPSEVTPQTTVHPHVCSKTNFNICSVVPRALPSVGMILLDLMIYKERSLSEGSFFSLSIIDEDISMVVDSRDISRFPEGSLYHTEGTWRLLRIGDAPLGFDECGIVAQVSAPLAHAEISTYYISTFYTDNTLVPDESIGKALRLLNERLSSYVCGPATNGFDSSPLINRPI